MAEITVQTNQDIILGGQPATFRNLPPNVTPQIETLPQEPKPIIIQQVPTITMLSAYTSPPNTFEAKSELDMYFLVPSISEKHYTYTLGVSASLESKKYVIQNRCLTNPIHIQLTIPDFLTINVQAEVVLHPKEKFYFTIGTNQTFLKNQFPATLDEKIIVDVVALDIVGPVYVDTTILPPADPNVIDPGSLIIEKPPVLPPPPVVQPPTASVLTLAWKDGLTGKIMAGSPPAGWTIEADGAAYAPIPTASLDTTLRYKSAVTHQIEDGTPPPGWVVLSTGEISPITSGSVTDVQLAQIDIHIGELTAQVATLKNLFTAAVHGGHFENVPSLAQQLNKVNDELTSALAERDKLAHGGT